MPEQTDPHARAWMPPVAKVGSVLLLPLDAQIAWRLGEVWSMNQYTALQVAELLEAALRDFLDEAMPDRGHWGPE